MAMQRGQLEPGHDEVGLTLVEMLAALMIISVVFAGAASALINLSRVSVNNERRVQATALMTQIHEEFQATPWDNSLLYEEELDLLDGLGDEFATQLASAASPPTFENRPIVTFSPACDLADDGCRSDEIALPFEVVEVDGRQYRIFRIVTQVEDREAADAGAIRRLTTIVEWEVMGRPLWQRLDSDRAATAADLGIDPEITAVFDLIPNSIGLTADGYTTGPLRLDVVFPSAMASLVQQVRATLIDAAGSEHTFTLGRVLLNDTIFRAVLGPPIEDDGGDPVEFEPGPLLVTLTYVHDGQQAELDGVVTFVAPETPEPTDPEDPGGEDPDPDFDASVVSVNAVPTTVRVTASGASGNHTLCEPLSITATVSQVDPAAGDVLQVDYNPTSGATTSLLDRVDATTYERVWAVSNNNSPWSVPDGSTRTDVFRVSVRNTLVDPPRVSAPEDVTVTFLGVSKCPK